MTSHPTAANAGCWWMPGIASRLGLQRCAACCTALGIPAGYGTPANQAKEAA